MGTKIKRTPARQDFWYRPQVAAYLLNGCYYVMFYHGEHGTHWICVDPNLGVIAPVTIETTKRVMMLCNPELRVRQSLMESVCHAWGMILLGFSEFQHVAGTRLDGVE